MIRKRLLEKLKVGWCSCIVIVMLALSIERLSRHSQVNVNATVPYGPHMNFGMPVYPPGYNVPERPMYSRHPIFPMPGSPAYYGHQGAMGGWDTQLQCYPYPTAGPNCFCHHEYPIDLGYDWTMPNRQFSQVIRMRSQAFGMNTFHPIFHIIKNTQFPAKARDICEHSKRRLARITETTILNLYYQLVSEVGYDSVGAIVESYCGLVFQNEPNGTEVPIIFKASSDCHITIEKGDPKMKYYVIAE